MQRLAHGLRGGQRHFEVGFLPNWQAADWSCTTAGRIHLLQLLFKSRHLRFQMALNSVLYPNCTVFVDCEAAHGQDVRAAEKSDFFTLLASTKSKLRGGFALLAMEAMGIFCCRFTK